MSISDLIPVSLELAILEYQRDKTFEAMLFNLDTGFIASYVPRAKERGEYYKVIDEFCLFYLYWLHPHRGRRVVPNQWLQQTQKPTYHVWSGYAFEAVCHKHSAQIIHALNIKTVENISNWRLVIRQQKAEGAQIDLLIDRSDNAITLCEIKYTDQPFLINKQYAENLMKKVEVFRKTTGTKKQIFLAMIAATRIKPNKYSQSLITSIVTLDALFQAPNDS